MKESVLGQIYVDQEKTKGVDVKDAKAQREHIYEQYVAAFKKGTFDLIKEEYDPATQEIIPHKYFSGGVITDAQNVLKERTSTGSGLGQLTPRERRLLMNPIDGHDTLVRVSSPLGSSAIDPFARWARMNGGDGMPSEVAIKEGDERKDVFKSEVEKPMNNVLSKEQALALWNIDEIKDALHSYSQEDKDLNIWRLRASISVLSVADRSALLSWISATQGNESPLIGFVIDAYHLKTRMSPLVALWDDLHAIEDPLKLRNDKYASEQTWTQDHLPLWERVLEIAQSNNLLAHGTANYYQTASTSRRRLNEHPQHHWALLNIMVEGRLVDGEFGKLIITWGNPYEATKYGPDYVIAKSGDHREFSTQAHAIYLIPDKSVRPFFEKGLNRAVELSLMSPSQAQVARDKIMTYQEFIRHRKRISDIVNGKVLPRDVLHPKASSSIKTEDLTVTVRLPTPLQKLTNGQAQITVRDVSTLALLIDHLDGLYSGMKNMLIKYMRDRAWLNNDFKIDINGDDMRVMVNFDTELQNGDEISIVSLLSDGAMMGQKEKELSGSKGGIDLNPANMKMKSNDVRGVMHFPQLNPQQIHKLNVDGLFPVIINITPITNFPQLLGFDAKSPNDLTSSMDTNQSSDSKRPNHSS